MKENKRVIKWLLILILICGALLGGIAWWKKSRQEAAITPNVVENLIDLSQEKALVQRADPLPPPPPVVEKPVVKVTTLPRGDRIEELFNTGLPKLSQIVETVTYKRQVEWLPGRAAWLGDYATEFSTSKHFIARSLNRAPDYFKQNVKEGDRFNVFRKDKKIAFHLVVVLDQCKMLLYCLDLNADETIFLKSYDVGIGRKDPKSLSGSLTPLGTYALGSRVAIYQPGTMGVFHQEEREMVQVFGTRWIPFEKEVQDCTAIAKGLGIHGAPWIQDPKTKKWGEDLNSIGRYSSDGCIRLATKDVEELYAIIITKPTFVEIVPTFGESKLAGKEK